MRIALFGLCGTFKEKLATQGVPWSARRCHSILLKADGITQR